MVTSLTGESLLNFGGFSASKFSSLSGCVEEIKNRLSDAHPCLGGFLCYNIKISITFVNVLKVNN